MLNVPVAHIEAGLRSYNRTMPEETNRVLTDHVSRLLFCPTQAAAHNLAKENILSGVHIVGDVMIDALLENWARARFDILDTYKLETGQYFLATIHRASNTDDANALRNILDAFARFTDTPILLPIHPRLQSALGRHHLMLSSNVIGIPPIGYLEMLGLVGSAHLVLTDSGGLQKEAYALRVPCVTLRNETEWTETIDAGWNRLSGASCERIVSCVEYMLSNIPIYHPDLYGDGKTSERIVQILNNW